MPTMKVLILSVAMAGGLVLTGVTTAAINTGHAPTRAALAANVASSPLVDLDNCPNLAEGDHSGCVNQLQTELNADNGTNVPVDGIFGSETKTAVITFQENHHIIPADGIVGPQTKAALDNPGSSPVATFAPDASTGGVPPWPGAQSCVNPHCYDRAVDYHSGLMAASTRIQSTWFSVLDQTQEPYQTPAIENSDWCGGTCPWFMTREMWLGDLHHWIEVGLRNGYEDPRWRLPDGAPGCGCQAYFQFWEDGPGSADTHIHVIANITPDNAWHTYGISRVSGTTFDITVDGQIVGVSTASGAASFGVSAIGSETSARTTVQPLSYMNMACQSWSVEDASGRWSGVGNPNGGLRGHSNPYHGSLWAAPFNGSFPFYDSAGGPDQTYVGGWNSATHQLCIGKGGL